MTTKKQHQEAHARKVFFVILITWVAAIPVAIALQLIMRSIFKDTDTIIGVVNVIASFVVLYGFLGWIPLIASAFYWEFKK